MLQSSSDGNTTISTISNRPTSSGLAPMLSPSLPSSSDSRRMFCEAWKYGNVTACEAAEFFSSESIVAYFSGPSPTSLSLSLRLLALLWLLFGCVGLRRRLLQLLLLLPRYRLQLRRVLPELRRHGRPEVRKDRSPFEVEGRWKGGCAD